jgi:3-oxoacyl-[acyl-carrier protein] reductase
MHLPGTAEIQGPRGEESGVIDIMVDAPFISITLQQVTGNMDITLDGRIALITGASRRKGLGAAISRALAAKGADIFLTYWSAYDRIMPWGRDEEHLDRFVDELRDLGVRVQTLEVDLSSAGAATLLLDVAEETLGPPSILVNNATYSTRDDYRSIDAATLDAHYAVNIRAPALLATQFAHRYTGGPGGRIINLASGPSLGPMPGELSYAMTKAAIEAFTRTLAVEVASKNITVNAVNPGPTDTGWMTDKIRAELLEKFPLGRIGAPEDAARVIAWLATDDAEWITGQVIHSEGGFVRS